MPDILENRSLLWLMAFRVQIVQATIFGKTMALAVVAATAYLVSTLRKPDMQRLRQATVAMRICHSFPGIDGAFAFGSDTIRVLLQRSPNLQ